LSGGLCNTFSTRGQAGQFAMPDEDLRVLQQVVCEKQTASEVLEYQAMEGCLQA
jgi:hypothetical protein